MNPEAADAPDIAARIPKPPNPDEMIAKREGDPKRVYEAQHKAWAAPHSLAPQDQKRPISLDDAEEEDGEVERSRERSFEPLKIKAYLTRLRKYYTILTRMRVLW